MTKRYILLVVLFSFTFIPVHPQSSKPTTELNALDNSFFRWKEFSFIQPWEKVKKTCSIRKITTYTDAYQNFYCGNISDTTKSYLLLNKSYHEFNNIWFDEVVLHIVGSTTSRFNYSTLYFIKQAKDSIKATLTYRDILKTFKAKYGNSYTEHLERNKKEIVDSMTENTVYSYINETNPFSTIDVTEWKGNNNIHMKLRFIPEGNLIILSIGVYSEKSFYLDFRNWFFESNYDEKFTAAFKEFDFKNGYKALKFGMLKSSVKKIVKYKDPDILKQHVVVTPEYKNWFYIPFDYCQIMFNKKNQLYDVSLSKDEYSNKNYDQFLKELSELFGNPTKYKEKLGDSEFTVWKGKNLNIIIMRPEDNSVYVGFSCPSLDDSSPTDKLY